jgi:sn-glycerol 3-phosphate transport system ATP-binding protein
MTTLSLRNLHKSYGRTPVIHGIDLEVATGEFIVIVGPSGCGKSTLLRMVAGLESVTAGDLYIGADRVNDREPMERNIAMVFQNYALYPHMTVAQNMGYALKIAGRPKEEIARRVGEAARMLQLDPYLARRPRELSGGQRQRVAMGRAIVRDPSVFLFDEPLSNLDAKLRVQMRQVIKALQRKLGVTSLYVTHDQVEAMTLADRMVVMNAGRAEQVGTPLEVYEGPATVFAAQFIGSPAMNLLDGVAEGGAVRLADGTRVPVAVRAEGPVRLGLRPEHLRADPEGPLEVALRLAEPLGAATLVHGTLGAGGADFVASLPGVHREASLPAVLRFAIAPEAAHVFDAASGRRIG